MSHRPARHVVTIVFRKKDQTNKKKKTRKDAIKDIHGLSHHITLGPRFVTVMLRISVI